MASIRYILKWDEDEEGGKTEKKERFIEGGSGRCVSVGWGVQYGDVSTLKVRRQHFPSIRQPFCQVCWDRTELVPASQPALNKGHIYYMPCPHNTLPRWQG